MKFYAKPVLRKPILWTEKSATKIITTTNKMIKYTVIYKVTYHTLNAMQNSI